MLRDITVGQYYRADSPIHRLDPRTKILWTLFYMIVLFLLKTPLEYGVFILFTLGVIVLSTVPLKYILKGLRPILFLLMFTVVLNLFLSQSGTTIWEWKFLHLTTGGIRIAVTMAVRLILLVTGTSLLTLTTSPIVLTDGMESLMRPLGKIGVPSHEIAMMMSLALRFIPTLLEETDKIMKAQSSRGADFESGNFLQRVRAMIPILVPLFISAFRRADDLAIAMECRCYQGGGNRTTMKKLAFTRGDAVALLAAAVLLGLIVTLKVVMG